MDNPNVASGSSSTPNLLDTIGGPFQLSNAESVGRATYTFGAQSDVAGQPSMVPQGAQPAFEKVQPKAVSTSPGPMGTDYKP